MKLFYGETPKCGSGRSSSIGGNSQQSESMNEGETIWIVDDSGNGVSSFSASASVRSVEIASNCVFVPGALSARRQLDSSNRSR